MDASTNDEELLVSGLFAYLFEGNPDRIGTEEGGSVETDLWWDDLIEAHLLGESAPIGVYPIDPKDGLCKWGCIDFDEGDLESQRHALRVTYLLNHSGVRAWPERSRSKGFHVWVFVRDWIDPQLMRDALLYACEFVDAPTKEINPKQTTLSEGQVGNYVRLPYPGGLARGWVIPERDGRRVVVDLESGFDIPLDLFAKDAWEKRTEPAAIADLARRHTPKPAVRPDLLTRHDYAELQPDDILGRLGRDARRLLKNGPKNADRSSALVALAGRIARDGTHEPEEIEYVLHEADKRWGKYTERGDADLRLGDIVDKVLTEKDAFY